MNVGAFDYVNNLKLDVNLNDSQIILDYGAGTGIVAKQILKYVKSIWIVLFVRNISVKLGDN